MHPLLIRDGLGNVWTDHWLAISCLFYQDRWLLITLDITYTWGKMKNLHGRYQIPWWWSINRPASSLISILYILEQSPEEVKVHFQIYMIKKKKIFQGMAQRLGVHLPCFRKDTQEEQNHWTLIPHHTLTFFFYIVRQIFKLKTPIFDEKNTSGASCYTFSSVLCTECFEIVLMANNIKEKITWRS